MSESLTIAGVPPAVTRAQVMEALRVLGIDPSQVTEVTVGPPVCTGATVGAVTVTVYADQLPDTPGRRWTGDGKTAATHRLTIPILDKEIPA